MLSGQNKFASLRLAGLRTCSILLTRAAQLGALEGIRDADCRLLLDLAVDIIKLGYSSGLIFSISIFQGLFPLSARQVLACCKRPEVQALFLSCYLKFKNETEFSAIFLSILKEMINSKELKADLIA